MGLFSRKTPRVVRKGVGDDAVETVKVRKVGREKVTVRRVTEAPPVEKVQPSRKKQTQRKQGKRGDSRRNVNERKSAPSSSSRSKTRSGRPPRIEVVPPETARKQMLVRHQPHQTQIVVLEGPVLVEHYVTRSDKTSLVGNVYLGKVRNVLPGMEAAFVDFGEGKNGVLYAGDINYPEEFNGKKPRIEMALKTGDSVLVQVVKDAMGHKGARLTNQISIPGRYLVLAPDAEVKGISRRLSDEERRRLRSIINELRPEGMGVIVRTAAEGASEDDIRADMDRLKDIWDGIVAKQVEVKAPDLIYEEPPLVLRVIREHFTRDFRRLMIDDPKTYERVMQYLEGTEADLTEKVKIYEDDMSIFERFHVDDQLAKALDRKVWLPSGGHIVIDRTEALTVVDVNTGRFVGHSNLEETVLQNNLESAEEIARQLRLRDIGGIIVIDFIDMEDKRNQEKVLLRLREHLAKDKTRTQVFDVSNLGLVEMTRKNVSEALLETFSEVCERCNGRGVVLNDDAALFGKSTPKAKAAASGQGSANDAE
ncbi:MAG: Rne/Rng family ribonuclease [Acidimicrobiia bacterium]|nr:Rne/Rng family ribonuclease [Acidimicrobiia bacterium]NNF65487.1 Rne/Rng family ribonuclease [Acidimicrobiia bacterium]